MSHPGGLESVSLPVFFLLFFFAAPGHGLLHDALPADTQIGEEVRCLAGAGAEPRRRGAEPGGGAEPLRPIG